PISRLCRCQYLPSCLQGLVRCYPPTVQKPDRQLIPASSRRLSMPRCAFSTSQSPVDNLPSALTITGGRRLWRNPLWITRLVMHSMRGGVRTACAQAGHKVMLSARRCFIGRFTAYPQKGGCSYTTSVSIFLNLDRKSTRLNSSHVKISYAVFCLKKKTT